MFKPKNILLVQPHLLGSIVKQSLKENLNTSDLNILHSENEEEAFRIIEKGSPDLIIGTINAPNIDAAQLIYHINTKEKKIPFLGVFESYCEKRILRILELGAKDVIQIPFQNKILAFKVKQNLYKL